MKSPETDHYKSDHTRDFINLIHQDHEHGYRFTFFVGAGLSRPAGYPLPAHLGRHYLPYCIMRVLALDPLSDSPQRDRFPRWDPRSVGWPRMDEEIAERWSWPRGKSEKSKVQSELPDAEKMTVILTKWLTMFNEDLIKKECPELSRALVASALGALQDWRSALRFLCQVQMVKSKLELVRPDYAVQDSMFQALLKMCEPGLGHRMVAALSTVLRCNCIVTTNFDDLIEKAFAAVPLSLTTFEVAQPAPMPGATIVCSQRSLVKMNGGNFSLITNETLDAEPSPDDHESFLGYLRGLGVANVDARAAIIVTGVGGTERRTLALFRHALERLPHLHIYWIAFAHDETDAERVRTTLKLEPPFSKTGKVDRRLLRLAHKEHGLLLQQLFMRITRSLPSSGVVFPGLWRLPLPPIINRADEEESPAHKKQPGDESAKDLKKEAGKEPEAQREKLPPKLKDTIAEAIATSRMVLVLSTEPESAVRRVCARVAGESSQNVAWLDLDQIGNPWGLLLRILQMSARMHGAAEIPPALDFHEWNEDIGKVQRAQFIGTMKHILRCHHVRLFEDLVIYLNGLDVIASHAPYAPEGSGNMTRQYEENESILTHLWDCLHKIARDATCGIKFVILGSLYEKAKTKAKTKEETKEDKYSDSPIVGRSLSKWLGKGRPHVQDVWEENMPQPFIEKRIQAAENWHRKDRLRIAYLYLVCSFRYSRHPVGISRTFGRYAERVRKEFSMHYEDAFKKSDDWLDDWLKPSSDRPFLREKLGGLLWMHPRIKSVLRPLLVEAWQKVSGDDHPYEILMMGNLLARHYGQMLLATADPLAGLELVHHMLRALEFSFIHYPSRLQHPPAATPNAGKKAVQPGPAKEKTDEEVELEALALHMIQHGIVAMKLCRPLLHRHLASDFLEASLDGLDQQFKELRESLEKYNAPKVILGRLLFLELETTMGRGDVLLRSVRSEQLHHWFSNVDTGDGSIADAVDKLESPASSLHSLSSRSWSAPQSAESLGCKLEVPQRLTQRHESRRLKNIGGLILARKHIHALEELKAVWKELAAKVCKQKQPEEEIKMQVEKMIEPLISRLAGGLPDEPARKGDYVARQWLYYAWITEPPMTEAMMEHWRRYIVRASLWSTMLILNRTQASFLQQPSRDPHELQRALKAGIWIADFGLEILRNVEHSRDSITVHEQTRLRCLIALGRAYEAGSSTRPLYGDYLKPVMRSLNGLRDASAWVEEFPFRDADLERVIIALRSAEVRLIALWNDAGFNYLLKVIMKQSPENEKYTVQECVSFKEDCKLDLVALRGNGEQILSLLDSAEQILRTYPKSVWWIWILWALKARISEFYFSLRAWDAMQAGPHATANVDTLMHVPNSLRTASRGDIFSAIRMQGITDPLRIARIIRSQHGIFAAEVFRRRLQQTPESLTFRRKLKEKDLARGMREALRTLKRQIRIYEKEDADTDMIKFCKNIHTTTSAYVKEWETHNKDNAPPAPP